MRQSVAAAGTVLPRAGRRPAHRAGFRLPFRDLAANNQIVQSTQQVIPID